jgi:hypothetical protein
MANDTGPKMIITVDIDSEKITKVEVTTGLQAETVCLGSQTEQPLNPDGGYRFIGLLLAYDGSQCITINLPGGGSYTYCH